MFDPDSAFQSKVEATKSLEYGNLVRHLRGKEPKIIFSHISNHFVLDPVQGESVRSPKQVVADKRGTVIELNELLYPILMPLYQDLILCFYEIETDKGMIYHSQLVYRHSSKNRWVGLERTHQWLSGKLDGLVGTLNFIMENTMAHLQNHFNGTVVYRGTGLVSLSGDSKNIHDYVEKVKRFYKPE